MDVSYKQENALFLRQLQMWYHFSKLKTSDYKLTNSTWSKCKNIYISTIKKKVEWKLMIKDYPAQKTNDCKWDYFLQLLSSVAKAEVINLTGPNHCKFY